MTAPPPVVFDLDGVFVDSRAMYAGLLQTALSRRGLEVPSERLAETRIPHAASWLGALVPPELPTRDRIIREATDEVRQAARRRCDRLPVRTGALGMLQRLAATRPLCLVTNSTRRFAERTLGPAGMLAPFVRVVGGDDGHGSKADALRAVAAELGERVENVIYVGDTVTDVRYGREAGCVVVVLYTDWSWDEGRLDRIEAARPDAIAHGLEELESMLNEGIRCCS